jgi:hypothetical protein
VAPALDVLSHNGPETTKNGNTSRQETKRTVTAQTLTVCYGTDLTRISSSRGHLFL